MISFWQKEFESQVFDFTIVGAGFTGLFAAYYFLETNPNASVCIIDTAFPPPAASTRNAGFACFGSPTEILDDLTKETEQKVFERIKMRFEGIEELKSICGLEDIRYTDYGGYEIFSESDNELYRSTLQQLPYLNELVSPLTKQDIFKDSKTYNHQFKKAIRINREGQLNPFLVWKKLYSLISKNTNISFYSARALEICSKQNHPLVSTNKGVIESQKLIVATNGFTKQLLPKLNIVPARAQVLITSPIKNLSLKGSFHKDRGYVYFRNVGSRVLIGGYRNMDKETEETDNIELNNYIQKNLEDLLRDEILPNSGFSIEHRWAGIMGFGENQEKDFVLEKPNKNVVVAVRLGGMGVAISSALAKKAVRAMS